MKLACAIAILAAIVGSANAFGFHGFHYKGLKEPRWIGPRSANKKWIEQPLDHFNHRDNRTWQMRYYEEDKYFDGSGPILIMLGGEWTISPGYLQTGLMHSIAKQHGALMYYTEHRYYGMSRPTDNLSVNNMLYLNVDQALADVANFIRIKKSERNAEAAKVIVFGGSYAGNMAAWIRIKYPHLVQGAVASSAPVQAKADFYEYFEVVTNSLRRYDEQCVSDVETAFKQAEKLLLSTAGGKKLKNIFNLCDPLDVNNGKDVSYFMLYLMEKFASAVQYNAGTGKNSNIGKLCARMTDSNVGTPIQRLGAIVRTSSCSSFDYLYFINWYKKEAFTSDDTRQWTFQTCVEYGYHQTTNSSKSVFGTRVNLDFFLGMCTDLYGKYYDRSLLESGITRTNMQYGGRLPDASNVIFANGDVDPWHSLSVLEDLNESSPAILIPGASHCQDLQPNDFSDSYEMLNARKKIRMLVSGWIEK